MHYELYIDVLFFTNFMMDSLLLFALRRMMKCPVPGKRILLGGAAGALGTCLTFAVPMPAVCRVLLNAVGVGILMLKAGLGVKSWKAVFKALELLYITAFLLGGILQVCYPYIRTGSLFFAAAAAAYAVLHICWRALTRMQSMQKKICEITLYAKNGEVSVRALRDTGNTLTDPVSNEPVHVIDGKLAGRLLSGGVKEAGAQKIKTAESAGLRYIPYRTVGGAGVMPVMRIEKMCIRTDKEQWITKPVIGICGEMISEKEEYQMILNTDVLGGAKTWS